MSEPTGQNGNNNPHSEPPPPHYEATQYNTYASKYHLIKRLPSTYIETANFRAAAAPFIPQARILDLACGTGYYSRQLLEWGAKAVVGVDVSEGMISVAEESIASVPTAEGTLKFRVGDARTLGVVEGGGYDLVTGVWLLNYATNAEELRAMFEGIAANLKADGAFAGITTRPIPAAEMDIHKTYNDRIRAKKQESWGMDVRYAERLESGGWRIDISTLGQLGQDGVKFTTFHLPMEAYHTAAREAGMNGRFGWREVRLEGEDREEAVRDAGEAFFREYFEDIGPHFGVLVVEKGGS